MNTLREELLKKHVSVTDTFVEQNPGMGAEEMYTHILNGDLRKKHVLPVLSPDLNSQSDGQLPEGHSLLLQITSIANIAQPSRRQMENSNPRILQIRLTDGHSKIVGLEWRPLGETRIGLSTPPGSKVLVTGAKVANP